MAWGKQRIAYRKISNPCVGDLYRRRASLSHNDRGGLVTFQMVLFPALQPFGGVCQFLPGNGAAIPGVNCFDYDQLTWLIRSIWRLRLNELSHNKMLFFVLRLSRSPFAEQKFFRIEMAQLASGSK